MQSIKILGMGDKAYDTLKLRLQKAIQELPLPAKKIEEIKDVESIIKHKVSAIPSILVAEKEMYINGSIPGVADIKKYLLEQLEVSNQIKKILVPTDFSPLSANALRFAQHISNLNGAEIELIYVEAPDHNLKKSLSLELLTRYEKDGLKGLSQSFISYATGKNNPKIKVSLLEGYPAETLVERSKKNTACLIVMGTTGRKSALEKLFGSISVHVAKNAKCPVLLVPDKIKFKGFQSFLCASNHFALDEVMMRKLIAFSQNFKAKVNMLKVQEKKGTECKVSNRKYEELFLLGGQTISSQLTVVECDHIVKGIQHYANLTQPDLIVLFAINRNLIERIFHKSVIQHLITKPDFPLLIMHYED